MLQIGIDIRSLMSPVRAGIGEYTHELLNAIFEIDKQNQYFLFYNSYTDISKNIPEWKQPNIGYVATRWPNKLFNASTKLLNAPKIDKKIKLDYFFSPNFGFTALTKKPKQILTVHDLSFEFFPQFFSPKQRLWHWAVNPKKQCQQAEIIITPSENTKRDIIDLYKIPSEKIKVIYPGVTCSNNQSTVIPNPVRIGEESLSGHLSFPPQRESRQSDTGFPLAAGMTTDKDPSSPEQSGSLEMTNKEMVQKKYNLPGKFILFLGTIEPRKNIIGLISAFEQCYSLLPTTYSLIIAGHKGWNDEAIFSAAQKSPARDKIIFIGSVAEIDKHILYSLADLFVYPSFYEGFGFPVAEAMACGVPVITSHRSSLPEITENAAYLVNPNRPSELAKAMADILKNESLREDFKKLGPEQAKKFSWTESAKEFIELL
ncbi:MAG: glycosyltransferase family 4 protein [Candidatus Magasanikbacteria bacterium]|nr:glycosyltransferase family 4 protein [Candidatus Magasanikbacteria bacterium]